MSEVRQDPLLDCLLLMIKHYGKHYSAEALLAGLPLADHQLTPTLFPRAAERAGFNTRLIKRPLHKISHLVLPAILILKNHQYCLLNRWNKDNTVEIYAPETGATPMIKPIAEVEALYSGHAILVSPVKPTSTHTVDNLSSSPRSWFWGTLWNYRNVYVQILLGALFINLFALASPLFVMNVYDRVVPNAAMLTLWTLAIGIFIIFLFDLILRFLRNYLIDVVGKKADILMASSLFQQVLTLEMKNKPSSIGAFISNLRDFENVRDFFTSATLSTLVDLPFVIIYVVLIGYIGGTYVMLVPIITAALILVIAWLIQKPLYKVIQQATQSAGEKHAVMVESFTGLEMLKCMHAEGTAQRKWEDAVTHNASTSLKSRFLSGAVTNFSYFAQQMMTVIIVIVGVYEISAGTLSLGGLIACSILSGRITGPLSQLISLLTRYEQAKYALVNLNQLMLLPSEVSVNKHYVQRDKITGNIEFKKVSFHYPQQEAKALIDLSLTIKAGEHVAIVGRIGSGKSTLEKLILRLYEPDSGSIYIDGVDILQWDPFDLRRNIGYVPQDILLFAGTVRDNIVMAHPWASDAQVLAAAKASGADNFIGRHPSGYGLKIGERGEGLSGGQRQTIAIARALVAEPQLYLLDEPTSSMDEVLEREWIQTIAPHLVGKTMVLVTHKPSLLALVDRIIVMDSGKVVVDGPRADVLQRLSQGQAKKTS